MVLWKLLVVPAFFVSLASAQDLQNRTVVRNSFDVTEHWYVPLWSITNLRTQSPNNTNIFTGVGYRGKSWWVEGMVQKQWNAKDGLWAADARFGKKFGKKGKTFVYFEPAPFLNQKGFYWFLYGETETWKKFSVGLETENVQKPGPDVVSFGPRINRPLGHFAGFDVSAAGAFRFDPLQQTTKITGHPHEIRLYLVFNRRFTITGH